MESWQIGEQGETERFRQYKARENKSDSALKNKTKKKKKVKRH